MIIYVQQFNKGFSSILILNLLCAKIKNGQYVRSQIEKIQDGRYK